MDVPDSPPPPLKGSKCHFGQKQGIYGWLFLVHKCWKCAIPFVLMRKQDTKGVDFARQLHCFWFHYPSTRQKTIPPCKVHIIVLLT